MNKDNYTTHGLLPIYIFQCVGEMCTIYPEKTKELQEKSIDLYFRLAGLGFHLGLDGLRSGRTLKSFLLP